MMCTNDCTKLLNFSCYIYVFLFKVVENKENADQDQSRSGANTSTQAKSVESSRDSHQDSTATENIKLVLTQRPEPRRTEEDFRLPEGSRKKAGEENCKQQ